MNPYLRTVFIPQNRYNTLILTDESEFILLSTNQKYAFDDENLFKPGAYNFNFDQFDDPNFNPFETKVCFTLIYSLL